MYYAAYTLQGNRINAFFRARWMGNEGSGRWQISLQCPGPAGRELHCYVASAAAAPLWGAHAGVTDTHGRLSGEVAAPAAHLDRVWLATADGRVMARSPGAPAFLPRELMPVKAETAVAEPVVDVLEAAEDDKAIEKAKEDSALFSEALSAALASVTPEEREPVVIEFRADPAPEPEQELIVEEAAPECLPMDVPAGEPPMQPLSFCPESETDILPLDAPPAPPSDCVSVWEALAARNGITKCEEEEAKWSAENMDKMLLDPAEEPCGP